jgi:hypothetical protein
MTNIIGNFNSGRVIPLQTMGQGYGTAFSGQQASIARNKKISGLNKLSMSMNPWLSQMADEELNSTWLAYQENELLKSAGSGELPTTALAQLKRTLQPMEQRYQMTQETQTEGVGQSQVGQGKVGGGSTQSSLKPFLRSVGGGGSAGATQTEATEFFPEGFQINEDPRQIFGFLENRLKTLTREQQSDPGTLQQLSQVLGGVRQSGVMTRLYETGQKEEQMRTTAEDTLRSMLRGVEGRGRDILEFEYEKQYGKPSVRGGSFTEGGTSVGYQTLRERLAGRKALGGDSRIASGVVSSNPFSSGDLGGVQAQESQPMSLEAELVQQGVMPVRGQRITRPRGRGGVQPMAPEMPTNEASEIQQEIVQQTFRGARNRNVGRLAGGYINIAEGGQQPSEESLLSSMLEFEGGGGEAKNPLYEDPVAIESSNLDREEKKQRLLTIFRHTYNLEDLGEGGLDKQNEYAEFLLRYPSTPKAKAFQRFQEYSKQSSVQASGGGARMGFGGLHIN